MGRNAGCIDAYPGSILSGAGPVFFLDIGAIDHCFFSGRKKEEKEQGMELYASSVHFHGLLYHSRTRPLSCGGFRQFE